MSPEDDTLPLIVRSLDRSEGEGFGLAWNPAGFAPPSSVGAAGGTLTCVRSGAGGGDLSILLLENIPCCPYELSRVYGPPIDADFVMQMAAGAAPGAAHIGDQLAALDPLADLDPTLAEMSIDRFKAEGMSNLDDIAIAPLAPGEGDHTLGRRIDRRAGRGGHVEALVIAPAAMKWIAAPAKAGGDARTLGRHADGEAVDGNTHQAHTLEIGHQGGDTELFARIAARDLPGLSIAGARRFEGTAPPGIVAPRLGEDLVHVDVDPGEDAAEVFDAGLGGLFELREQRVLPCLPVLDFLVQGGDFQIERIGTDPRLVPCADDLADRVREGRQRLVDRGRVLGGLGHCEAELGELLVQRIDLGLLLAALAGEEFEFGPDAVELGARVLIAIRGIDKEALLLAQLLRDDIAPRIGAVQLVLEQALLLGHGGQPRLVGLFRGLETALG